MSTASEIKNQFNELTIDDRLKLLYELWDELADDPKAVTLSEAQAQELDRRYERHLANPDEAIPWADVRNRVRNGRREP